MNILNNHCTLFVLFQAKMRIPGLSLLVLTALLQILQCTVLTSSLENLSKCQFPGELDKMCSCGQSSGGLILTCSGLNSTSDLVLLDPEIAGSVVKLEISGGTLPCLAMEDMTSLTRLQVMRVTNSQMREALCQKSEIKGNNKLRHLVTLDLSNNNLVSLDESLTTFHRLHNINVSNNQISSIHPIFSSFKNLKLLDISKNKLSGDLNQLAVTELPSSLRVLDISGIRHETSNDMLTHRLYFRKPLPLLPQAVLGVPLVPHPAPQHAGSPGEC